MTNEIDNTQDILDGRDVIARFEGLESEREALVEALETAEEAYTQALESKAEAVEERDQADSSDEATLRALDDAQDAVDTAEQDRDEAKAALREWGEENAVELKALRDFIAEGSDEWRHGETLIRDSYFKEYAMELAEEIGAVNRDTGWPNTCIDWERAARELKVDYTGADFDGVTYWYRS